jgi:hypothetical protein
LAGIVVFIYYIPVMQVISACVVMTLKMIVSVCNPYKTRLQLFNYALNHVLLSAITFTVMVLVMGRQSKSRMKESTIGEVLIGVVCMLMVSSVMFQVAGLVNAIYEGMKKMKEKRRLNKIKAIESSK